jgi:hypothetical protein
VHRESFGRQLYRMADLLAVSSVMASHYLGENLNNATIK